MTRLVRVTHDYPVAPRTLWDLVTDLDRLEEVCAGLVTFEGLPSGRIHPGLVAEVRVRLFGRLPPQEYRMEVVEVDDQAMKARSSEFGAGVRSWRHTFQVTASPLGARLTDTIEIDAGWLTWAYALWAWYLYRARHGARLKILGLEQSPQRLL